MATTRVGLDFEVCQEQGLPLVLRHAPREQRDRRRLRMRHGLPRGHSPGTDHGLRRLPARESEEDRGGHLPVDRDPVGGHVLARLRDQRVVQGPVHGAWTGHSSVPDEPRVILLNLK